MSYYRNNGKNVTCFLLSDAMPHGLFIHTQGAILLEAL